jgi:hypothetical protein
LSEERLGIPVVPFVASNPKDYGAFYAALGKSGAAIKSPPALPDTPGKPDVLAAADGKFKWTEALLDGAVKKTKESAGIFESSFSKTVETAESFGTVISGITALKNCPAVWEAVK